MIDTTKMPPTMRPDHICFQPECDKPLPEVAIKHEDPFCSSVCCREYYGTQLPKPSTTRRVS